jgi:predicted Rossmann fold flavoprotein
MDDIFDLIIIGGGAAGFFCAINAAEMNPAAKILILEKSSRVLSKVKVSGGGRCNVTHNCFNPFILADHYPRGSKALKQLFKIFQANDMVNWLEKKGVSIKAEDDGRMFPTSDDSQTIIDCFLRLAVAFKVKISLGSAVTHVTKEGSFFKVQVNTTIHEGRYVLVATGGSPNRQAYGWLESIGHVIVPPIPSLFTFNDADKGFVDLMGVSCASAAVRIEGTKFAQRGPVLLTHWGLSGPAVIKLSAWAAEHLHKVQYSFVIQVNWTEFEKEDDIRVRLMKQKELHPTKKISAASLFGLPQRLWDKLLALAGVEEHWLWGETPNKNLNKLLENLYRCRFTIKGKTTFKEEFVTCGGVDLNQVDLATMESKVLPGLYFAGEVLNIDGETGGFNFQAAWTTAFIAAKSMMKEQTD